MVSHRHLLQTLEGALLAGTLLSARERAEVAHLLHISLPHFKSFLQFPPPNASDRAQVLAKEVRLSNGPLTPLDDQDVQIALKLSDDLHLNEIECVSLLIAAHQEWSLVGREPLEILRMSLGLWFTERRALITTLLLLCRAVVLDEELDPDLVSDIHRYIEELLKSGLRQGLVTAIKDLNREEPAGCGGPGVEQLVVDSRGALVQRSSVAQRERLSLCQCIVFSCLIVRMGPQEMKDHFSLLRDNSHALLAHSDSVKLQIAYTNLFVILVSLMSDALSGSSEMPSVLAVDGTFQKEFQQQVMESGGDESVEGFCNCVRLVWTVFLMLVSNSGMTASPLLSSSSSGSSAISAVLDQACNSNAFKFLVTTILKTPAFQNDDEDMIFMYRAYLHKLVTSFLSQQVGRDKVKRLRDAAVAGLESSYYDLSYGSMNDDERAQQQRAAQQQAERYLWLLELVTEVYQHEPNLTIDNDGLWNFARFASENHTSHVSLAAFLKMLTALASSEEGARKVYLLLQNKTSWSVGWHTLFNSLNVYEQHFQQSLQTTGALLPPFQEGDAKALEAYLQVLKKVMENGNKLERSEWFPDIEPLFKLLSYENVPPYLKGALRNAIATFAGVSPVMKDKIWALLEQYDLPMVVGSAVSAFSSQSHPTQVYDMNFELNEVEARREEYPSTLSYVQLLNTLISYEIEAPDKGLRFLGIFRFIRDHIFATYSQRAFSDVKEKWQLVVACLKHFQLILSLFEPSDEDIRVQVDNIPDLPPMKRNESWGSITTAQTSVLPTIELMKDFMSGKTIFRNVMSIVMLGVNTVVEERVNHSHGPDLEEAVHLSLELLLMALNKDTTYVDIWRPVYQSVDAVLVHDNRQIVVLLEYIRYDSLQAIQQCSIRIMDILSGRIPQLVSIVLEAGIADNLTEDYAACLDGRSQENQAPESLKEDTGFLILQLLITNLSRPAPNITHLLLKFNIDLPVERTILQPRRHYSCLRVLLNILESLARPDVNAVLYEFGFQLLYLLAVDPVTSAAIIELLQSEKYSFFAKHLDGFASEPLPKRKTSQMLRTSNLHQRAWLLKLLAVELHVSDMDIVTQRENCQRLLSQLFTEETISTEDANGALAVFNMPQAITSSCLHRMKALDLLDIVKFQPAQIDSELPWELQSVKDDLMVNEILSKPAIVDEGGVYCYSERGDHLIELVAFRDRIWQEYKRLEIQHSFSMNEQRKEMLRDAVQHLLRWGWKYNKNLEEQAAQLHMLMGWTQLIEVGISRRFELLDFQLHVLLEILDASLTTSISQDCSLKMAVLMSQVVMTCMAKLQEMSFTCPAGESTDDVTYVDLLFSSRLSNSACQTILSKLVASILRAESSEALRRRQYTTLICYLQYCQGTVDPDLPLPVMRSLLLEGQDGEEDRDLGKLDKEQSDLLEMNLSVIKSDIVPLIDLLTKDLTQGSEMGKAMAFYTLDALVAIDMDHVVLNQIQSRGLLLACLQDISTNSYQAVLLPSPASVRRLYTLEAELSLLLRVGYHSKKRGAQSLFSMGVLQHLTSCKAIDVQLSDDARWEQVRKAGTTLPTQHERHQQIVLPVLRVVLCLTTLIESEKVFEKDDSEVVSEILEFVKGHPSLFARVLRDDRTVPHVESLEELDLVTAILSKVWYLVKTDEFGFNIALHNLASNYFPSDGESRNRYVLCVNEAKQSSGLDSGTQEAARKLELYLARVRCNLISYLFRVISKQGVRLNISNPVATTENISSRQIALGRQKQPTLTLIASLLEQAVADLEAAIEERSLLLAKVQDVNELSRYEVDDIVKTYSRVDQIGEIEGIRKRRYVAMVEMCCAAGNRDSIINFLFYIIEHALNILFIHYEKELQIPEQFREAAESIGHKESFFGSDEELRALNEKLLPSLQQLEKIGEEKMVRDKQIQRLVRTLKSRIVLALQ